MLKRILLAGLIALAPAVAIAQSTVIQGGSFTAGQIPKYNNSSGQPTVTTGGTSAGGSLGVNPSTLGITARCSNPPCVAQGAGPNGEDFVIFDGPTNDPEGYHYLGFSANIGNKATITTGAAGGAAAQGLQFIIDGTTYTFPDDFPQIPVEVDEGGTGRQALTQYNLLVGAGTSPVGLVAPSATSGVPLVSQGSSANPAYGTVAIAGGGTGQTTASGAINALLPSQAGQNGKVLSTDGSAASWMNVAGTGTVTSVTFSNGLTADINPCVAACTASLANIADDRIMANVSGGAAPPTANTLSAVLDATAGSAQGSLLMRGAATWAPLTPGTNGYALLSQGPGFDLAYGQYSIANLTLAGQTQGDIIYFNGTNWARLGVGTSGQALSGGTDPTWQAINGTQIRMGSDAQGDVLYFNGTNYVRLPAGTSGRFLQTQGAGANPAWAAAGKVVQQVTNTYATNTSLTNASIPLDDTIPQIGEGTNIVSQSITPTNASSTLYVTVEMNCGGASGTACVVALFRDSGPDAVATGGVVASGNNAGQVNNGSLAYSVSAGSTSATTFSVRGGGAGGTVYTNGNSGGRYFGGTLVWRITIYEILP